MPSTNDDAARLLRIYLEDHLAGAVAGTRRARRLADAEREGPDGAALSQIADDIDRDLVSLRAVIDHLGVSPRRYKQVATRVAEVAGLLKLNGQLVGRSPLTTLVETEAMLVALRGKLAGWETLRAVFGGPVLGSENLDELIVRGQAQLDAMAVVHEHAAVTALGAAPARN